MKYARIFVLLVIVMALVWAGCNGTPIPTTSPVATPTVVSVLPSPTVSPLPIPASGKPVENNPRELQSKSEEEQLMDFNDVVINGVPLLVLIIGLIQFAKNMGLSGKWLRVASALLGLGFGLAYQISLGMPTDFAGWLGASVYGLGLGVVASGLVDAARRIASPDVTEDCSC